ncbi:unnamed protein product [Sphacelaria rigidula]
MAWLPSQVTEDGTDSSAAGRGPMAICGFRDGSLTVVNAEFRGGKNGVDRRSSSRGSTRGPEGSIPWASKAGHIETVFCCAHKPGDADTLVTGSYGASAKVWHTPTMDLKVTLTGQTGAIYSVAWSLGGDRIASSSGEGTVWIWDAESGKAERRLPLHSQASYRVQWDPFHPTRLASVGADRNLVIFADSGVVERTLVHPAALFGCHWCPSCTDVIATACQDGNVRVFDVSYHARMEPQYILSGHSKRVFTVCWSPLLHATLASGSDDTTIMVWRIGPGSLPRSSPPGRTQVVSPSAVLRGHTSNVRPLHWNTELPWLLLSGSWDGTIRAWDIRRAGVDEVDHQLPKGNKDDGDSTPRKVVGEDACIGVMRDHVADVYGLSAQESRPFLYVSASRDTTLRQFTLEGVVSSLRTRSVISNSLTGCLGKIKESMRPGCSSSLCGQASKALQAKLHGFRREGRPPAEASRRLFEFFWGPDGVDDLWDVLRWVLAATANNPDKNAIACGGSRRRPSCPHRALSRKGKCELEQQHTGNEDIVARDSERAHVGRGTSASSSCKAGVGAGVGKLVESVLSVPVPG